MVVRHAMQEAGCTSARLSRRAVNGVGRRGPAIIFSLVAGLPLVHIANAHVLQLRYFQGGRIANDVVGRMETAIDEPEGREACC